MTSKNCPICLELMLPVEYHAVSLCWPVPHWVHVDCWNLQNQQGRAKCCVCRQYELGEEEICAIGTLINKDLMGLETWNQYPSEAQQLMRQFQKGKMTSRQLWNMVDAMEYKRSRENSPRKRMRSLAQRIVGLQEQAAILRIQAEEFQRETESILTEALEP